MTYRSLIPYAGLIASAVFLTLISLSFVRPTDCQTFCDAPDQGPCPRGSCRAFEQRTGLPLPVVVDDPGGGSPTGGWGKLGPEDLPNPMTFAFDVLFYSALLWLMWYALQIFQQRKQPEFQAILPPLSVVIVGVLVGLYLYWPVLTN